MSESEHHKKIVDQTTHKASLAAQLPKLKSLKARSNLNRTAIEKIADNFVEFSGSAKFLLFNLVVFVIWIIINVELLPLFRAYDPYPFIFLTTFVSLEAIILSIFVLISQNRQTQIDDLREEIEIQMSHHMQEQNRKILQMLEEVQQHFKITPKPDPELTRALETEDPQKIAEELRKEIESENHS